MAFEGRPIVDEELERRLSAADIAGLRRGLLALGEIKRSLEKAVTAQPGHLR